MKKVLVGMGLVAGVSVMAVVLTMTGGTTQTAEADAKTKPTSSGWKSERFCSLSESSTRNIQVRTIFEGKETIVACPDFGDCKVGTASKLKYFMSMMCSSDQYTGSWSDWDCDVSWLNLTHLERRELLMFTMQTTKPKVKSFDVVTGELRVGPIYGGVDLVVSGMKPSKPTNNQRFAFGGSPDILGMGGALAKSRIELHGECQAPPSD